MSFLCWSIASECFLLTNITITRLVVLVAFLPRDSVWQPSMSEVFMSIPESLQILITVSWFWSEASFEIPDISTLLCLLYCSLCLFYCSLCLLYCFDLDCFFSRFTILFWRFWLTFLTINNSLFNVSLAVTRNSFPFKFSVWSTRSSLFH